MSQRWKRIAQWTGKGLAGLAVLALIAGAVFVFVVLPRIDMGGTDTPPSFSADKTMAIKRQAADGTPYTVNNSIATFRLDLAKPDVHSSAVFTNYVSALRYCRAHGLSAMPSVQLVQGRLKTFDDSLCAALELAMAGRQVQALERLLAALGREGNAEASAHVATALLLAGASPALDADLRRRAEASRDAFLATPEARPTGFWDGDERLRRSFQSDRYLMRGFEIQDSPEVCVALSRALAGDAELREAFQRLREFGAKLTNPAQTVPFEALAELTPQEAGRRFSREERFALVAYSSSKEQTIIERLRREGALREDSCLMAAIIDAVRGGMLPLEPKPDSGWYDYQWHALETLLMPERGRESAKLKLSDAYRKRLENAFSSVLAKERETHVKRLPVLTIGSMLGADGPPKQVTVAPEFSAEPTPTVYLRLGRGYRFLRQALAATMGEEGLARVRRASADGSVNGELQETAWFCYGLYERLCLEIGQHPAYLPGEITAAEREQAVAVFMRWRGAWQDDPALEADTRVAAPIARWPDGRTRYWGTAGVRLEPVVYEYLDKPMVEGATEPVFAPCTAYLPTDVFLEFERASPQPLTRAEFRSLCDPCRDSAALHKALGAAAPADARRHGTQISRCVRSNWGWAVVAAVGLVFWKARRSRLWIVLGTISLVTGWGCLLVFSPVYRTTFIMRHIASANVPLGMLCENRLLPDIPLSPRLRGLSRVMADQDPQVRYLAARFLVSNMWRDSAAESNAWFQVGVKEGVLLAANDPDPEIASFAVAALGRYRDREVADFLLQKLASCQAYDNLCWCVIDALGEVRDTRAIEAIRLLCEDTRAVIVMGSIMALGKFPQPEAQAHLWRLAESDNPQVRSLAVSTIGNSCSAWWGPDLSKDACETKCDAMLLERVGKASLPFDVRAGFASGIVQERAALEANAALLEFAVSAAQTNAVLTCVARNCLKRHGLGDFSQLPEVISNVAGRAELADAAIGKDPAAVKQALANILSAAKDIPDSDTRYYAEWALDALQREPGTDARRRRQRRR